MDFTFLFIIILMLLALQSNLWYVAVGLFVLLLVTSKNKYLLASALIGGLALLLISFVDFGDNATWIILGALFVVLLLLSRKEAEHPGPDFGASGGAY